VEKPSKEKYLRYLFGFLLGENPNYINVQERKFISELGIRSKYTISCKKFSQNNILVFSEEEIKQEITFIKERWKNFRKSNYEKIGLCDEFSKLPYIKDFDNLVFFWIKNISSEDFLWICPEIAKIANKYRNREIIEIKISRFICNSYNEFLNVKFKGLKYRNFIIQNPTTNNSFVIQIEYVPSLETIIKKNS
jgi:hypothetical protein